MKEYKIDKIIWYTDDFEAADVIGSCYRHGLDSFDAASDESALAIAGKWQEEDDTAAKQEIEKIDDLDFRQRVEAVYESDAPDYRRLLMVWDDDEGWQDVDY